MAIAECKTPLLPRFAFKQSNPVKAVMNDKENQSSKSVIHPAIFPVPGQYCNSYNANSCEEPKHDYSTDNMFHSVSRASGCDFDANCPPPYDSSSPDQWCNNIPPDYSGYEGIGGDESNSAYSDYEEWAEDGNLETENLNAPRGGAGHTNHEANQTTCERGRKMYSNNTSAPGDGVPPPPSTIHIDQQYLGDSLYNASLKHPFLGVLSEKGTGKTTAAKRIIESCNDEDGILLMTPRKKLNEAMAKALGFYYYEDVKKEPNREIRRMMMRRMATTPQGLALLLAEFPDIQYKYILVDESEATASMLVSSVTDKKAKALASLKNAALKADNVILMDAAYAARSQKLMEILRGASPSGMLINAFLRWSNIHTRIIEGGRYSDRVETANALQVKYALEGKRFAISSGSAEYCELRADVLKEQFPHLNIGVFTSKSSKQVQRILADPSRVSELDIVIFSPAVSIGVSFDIKDHFSTVFGIYPNNDKTGSSDDAIQGLARIRHPSADEWIVVLDDDKHVYQLGDAGALMPHDISEIIANRWIRESWYAGVAVEVSTDEQQVAELWSVCEHFRFENKNNYKRSFIDAIESSGVTISTLSIDEVQASEESEKLTEKAKEKRTEKIRVAKSQSHRIDEEGYQYLKAMVKFRPDEVTQEQLDSMTRYRFEQKFNINCDKLTQNEVNQYLDWDEADLISNCINREIALASPDFVKEYTKARITGLGGSEAFKVDLVDEKLNFKMKQKILSYAVPYFDGAEYSHVSLKKHGAMVRYIERNHDEIAVTGVISLPKDWKEKPALLMNKLLEMCGYGHFSRRDRVGKKRVYVFVAQSNPVVTDLCASRNKSGSDWVSGTKRLIGLHEKVLKTEEGRTRLERLWQEAGRTDDMTAFLAEFKDDVQDIENGMYPDKAMLKIVANW